MEAVTRIPEPKSRQRLSPTEKAEMARETVVLTPLKSMFRMTTNGHAMVEVAYPLGDSFSQHRVHLNLQHEYQMVLVGVEKDEEYQIARYLHREHYDNAVLNGIISDYQ